MTIEIEIAQLAKQEHSAMAERASIVSWLRNKAPDYVEADAENLRFLADCIEAGDHDGAEL